MTIQVPVPPDLEAELRKHAAAAGKDLESFALEALRDKIGANGPQQPDRDLPVDQRVTEWLSWTASHPDVANPVDDSRESIYAERGE